MATVGAGAAAALIGLCPGLAAAQNAVTGGSVQVHSTFTNVGVQVTIAGDANHDAIAALAIDVNGAGMHPVHRLSRATETSFVGSAFFLPPATSYQVEVTLTDPDGVSNGTLTASGTTRSTDLPQSAGATYHVAPGGADGNDGSAGSPFATIAHGLGVAQPGDTVLVHAGSYHEEVQWPAGGVEGSPITLRAAGDGPAVMDGAEPGLKAPAAWTDAGGGLYSAAVAATQYVAVDGVRLWRYESLADLQGNTLGTAGGFFFDGATVYVRLAGDAPPAGHEIQVATFNHALWLEGTPDVVIDGLTIRCYGNADYSQGIMVRDGSHRVWIVNNTFENVMPGIWVKNAVDDLTVRGNTFSDRGLAEFGWQAVKDQGGMESGAIALDDAYDGQGIVFQGNVVHDSFDGLHICGQDPMTHPNNADVIGNSFNHLADDGMETDGDCSNIRILGNHWRDSLTAVSVAPAATGPTYVIRNLANHLNNVAPDSQWMTRAMKFNVGDPRPSGDVFAYHNTAVTYEAQQSAFTVTDTSMWTEVHVANNIWIGTDFAFYYESSEDDPFFEDYDLMFSTGSRLVDYQGGKYGTPADYFAATGQCEHCLASAPAFTDEPAEDYTLTQTSPAVDQGIPIPGVNDDFVGSAPDMGALEYGSNPPWPDGGPGGNGGSGAGGVAGNGSGASGAANGSAPGTSDEGSGCGCRAAGAPTKAAQRWLAGLGLAVLGRRLTSRRRQPRG